MVKNNFIFILAVAFLATGAVANAYVASSANFRLESDSVNYGGQLSTSTNFSMQDVLMNGLPGDSTSSNYSLSAGPLALGGAYTISVTEPGDLTLSGTVTSLRGGIANGSVSVTVVTDNPAGYQLKLSGTPLSSGSNSFSSFSGPATWSVDSGSNAFGFSTDSSTWNGVDSTSRVVVTENTSNSPSGTATTINFRAETKKTSQSQAAGSYSSTITLTALPL